MDISQDVFEHRMVALEGGVNAVAVASGQSAQFLAILNIAAAGDNIVSPLVGMQFFYCQVLMIRDCCQVSIMRRSRLFSLLTGY